MKRHTRLVQLSREHHTALRLGRHLLAGGAQAGQALIDHVRFEERELFSVLETLFEEARP